MACPWVSYGAASITLEILCAEPPALSPTICSQRKGRSPVGLVGCFPGSQAGAALDSLSRAFVFTGKALFLQKVSGVLLPSTELTVGSLAACDRKVLGVLSGPSGLELSVSL